jgi:uncharacterized surface protein with fasciclin (FAS1) repeats
LLSSTLQTIGGTNLFANATASSVSAFDFVPSITAFIPSDSAFATALRCSQGSNATINALALLGANIVEGFVAYSPLLVDGAFFQSINGDDITVLVSNGTKYVNGARIVQEDIVIQNGVVHIVDQVSLPRIDPMILLLSNNFRDSWSSTQAFIALLLRPHPPIPIW